MNWISVKSGLPKHRQLVLVYTIRGQCVCVFIDSAKMNEELCKKGHSDECVNTHISPYYFCSQENKGHTLKGVSHWMPLPESPNDAKRGLN